MGSRGREGDRHEKNEKQGKLYSIIFLLISYINIQFSSRTLYFTVINAGQEVTGSVCVLLALLIT